MAVVLFSGTSSSTPSRQLTILRQGTFAYAANGTAVIPVSGRSEKSIFLRFIFIKFVFKNVYFRTIFYRPVGSGTRRTHENQDVPSEMPISLFHSHSLSTRHHQGYWAVHLSVRLRRLMSGGMACMLIFFLSLPSRAVAIQTVL